MPHAPLHAQCHWQEELIRSYWTEMSLSLGGRDQGGANKGSESQLGPLLWPSKIHTLMWDLN